LYFDVAEPLRFPNVGQIPLPLDGFKETTNFDVPDAAVAAADGSGGILASDTTPKREAINDATDGCQRILWAAADQQQVTCQALLPLDFDPTADVVFHARVASGDTDAVGFTVDTFFDETDTKVTDTTTTHNTTTYTEITATIANADIPTGAQTVTIGLPPTAHASHTHSLTACWLEYGRKFPLEASEGLYCCHKVIQQAHKLTKVRVKAQNVTTTGTVTVTLKKRDPNEARGGSKIATVLENADLEDHTNVSTTYTFALLDAYKGVAPADREYFVVVTGTSAEDRFEEPHLLIEATDVLT
jgi:hypothetical protein